MNPSIPQFISRSRIEAYDSMPSFTTQMPTPSPVDASPGSFEDDLLAGGTLIAISIVGILIHAIEMVAMCRLVRKVIGFRFFLALSCSDIWLLLIFGAAPGWIIISKKPGFLTAWNRTLHTWADTCWFSMCYMNVFIALTRFACVVFPLQFRKLRRQSTCWLICASVWLLAFGQSWAMNSAPWFVVLWYDANTYGFACDWNAYVASGTRDLYLCLNLLIIGVYLSIYVATAGTIFFKRNLRFQFFSTVMGHGSSASRSVVVAEGQESPPPPVTVSEQPPKVQLVRVQRNSRTILVMRRTISVLRSSNGSNDGSTLLMNNLSLEVRLVIPCCVNSIIFVIAQLIIIHGGIGTGKWAGFSVMFIFCIQSIAPPLLRFTFSDVLREEAMIVLGIRKSSTKRRRFKFWTVVASLISRQQQH